VLKRLHRESGDRVEFLTVYVRESHPGEVANGKPLESFQHDASDSYSPIASATEHDGYLYLGSFAREGLARFKLPSLFPSPFGRGSG
jgi:hypothetical protein